MFSRDGLVVGSGDDRDILSMQPGVNMRERGLGVVAVCRLTRVETVESIMGFIPAGHDAIMAWDGAILLNVNNFLTGWSIHALMCKDFQVYDRGW